MYVCVWGVSGWVGMYVWRDETRLLRK